MCNPRGKDPTSRVNPAEMDTQIMLPGLPSAPPPSCLEAVAAALKLNPPVCDYRLQYKVNFTAMLAERKTKKKQKTGSVCTIVG